MKDTKKFLIRSSIILWIIITSLVIIEPPFFQNIRPIAESGYNLNDQIKVNRQAENNTASFLENYKSGNISFETYKETDFAGSLDDAHYWFLIEEELISHFSDSGPTLDLIEISKPQLDDFTVYFLNTSGDIISEKRYGRNQPFNQRDYFHRNYFIDIPAEKSISSILFHVNTDSYLQFPVTLWQHSDWVEMLSNDLLGHGLFYGAIFIMLIYNVILGLSIKDKNYLYFSLFILFYALLQGIWDGYAFQFLWPNNGLWDLHSNPIMINLVSLALLAFTMHFMKVSEISFKLENLYKVSQILHLIGIIVVFIFSIQTSIFVAMFNATCTFILTVITIGLKRIKRKDEALFLLAWQFFLAANGLNILAGMHLIPYTSIVSISPKIAMIGLIALFSLALSEKLNTIQYLKGIAEEKRSLLKSLNDMHVKISSAKEIQNIFDDLLEMFNSITQYEKGYIILFNHGHLTFDYFIKNSNEIQTFIADKDFYNKLYRLIEMKQPIKDEQLKGLKFLDDQRWDSICTIPLVNLNHPIGFIVLVSEKSAVIDKATQEVINDYATQIAITIDNKRLLNNITDQARYDFLTKAYNRRFFFESAQRLYNSIRPEEVAGTLMIDIDDFKHVNDTYGHLVGDEVLRLSVERIQKNIRDCDILGRYGGEEFIVFVKDISKENIKKLANRVLKAFQNEPISLSVNQKKLDLNITISIGISYSLEGKMELFALTDAADVALYKAKNNGKNQIAV